MKTKILLTLTIITLYTPLLSAQVELPDGAKALPR